MQDLTPLRPAFWNVPLWAEIGVYVIGIAAVVLCIAGIVRAVKQRQASCPPEALPDRNARLGRTLLEVFWQKRIRDTAAGKNHFVLFWGFIFLFFGTAIATIDWDIAWLIFGKRILSGNIYLAYKFVLDLAGLLALIALGFSVALFHTTPKSKPTGVSPWYLAASPSSFSRVFYSKRCVLPFSSRNGPA